MSIQNVSNDQWIVPSRLLEAMMSDERRFSTIDFYCPNDYPRVKIEEAMDQLERSFTFQWRRAVCACYRENEVNADEWEWFDTMNKDPLFLDITEYGFQARINHMTIWYSEEEGSSCWDPLIKALNTLQKRYPRIQFGGYIAYWDYFSLGGQVEQCAVWTDPDNEQKVGKWITKALAESVLEDEFWDRLLRSSMYSDSNKIIAYMLRYENEYEKDYLNRAKRVADTIENKEDREEALRFISDYEKARDSL